MSQDVLPCSLFTSFVSKDQQERKTVLELTRLTDLDDKGCSYILRGGKNMAGTQISHWVSLATAQHSLDGKQCDVRGLTESSEISR